MSVVTAGTPAGFAAKKATSTIPIVLSANSDPVGVGLVQRALLGPAEMQPAIR